MKALFIVIITLFFKAIPAFAGSTVVGDLTFSGNRSNERVDVSFSTDSNITDADHERTVRYLQGCFVNDSHPLDWGKGLSGEFNIFFKVDGPLASVLSAVKAHKTQTDRYTSWIWAKAQNPEIKVYLKEDGTGFVTLHQGSDLVGHAFCRSMPGNGRPAAGTCEVVRVHSSPAPTEFTHNDERPTLGRRSIKYESWMPWALETDNSKGGIFIHGGSLATSSKGCIRLPKKFAEALHKITKSGARVVITLEK